LLEILENGDNTVDLVALDYQKYIHIRLNNIIKTFDENGVMTVENNYYPVPQCNEDNFKRNEFEETYWNYVKGKRYQYCIDSNDGVFLQGTRDSLILEQDHAYFLYEVWRCNEDTK
jgi:hypothetical protein